MLDCVDMSTCASGSGLRFGYLPDRFLRSYRNFTLPGASFETVYWHVPSCQNEELTTLELSFRAKRGISRSTTERFNYEILRVAQDDHLVLGAGRLSP